MYKESLQMNRSLYFKLGGIDCNNGYLLEIFDRMAFHRTLKLFFNDFLLLIAFI